jgi:hypothetical protein
MANYSEATRGFHEYVRLRQEMDTQEEMLRDLADKEKPYPSRWFRILERQCQEREREAWERLWHFVKHMKFGTFRLYIEWTLAHNSDPEFKPEKAKGVRKELKQEKEFATYKRMVLAGKETRPSIDHGKPSPAGPPPPPPPPPPPLTATEGTWDREAAVAMVKANNLNSEGGEGESKIIRDRLGQDIIVTKLGGVPKLIIQKLGE